MAGMTATLSGANLVTPTGRRREGGEVETEKKSHILPEAWYKAYTSSTSNPSSGNGLWSSDAPLAEAAL